MKRCPMSWHVSQAWHPPKVTFWLQSYHTCGPKTRIPKLLKKLEPPGAISTMFVSLPSSLWQPFYLLISIFQFLTSRQALFLRSLIITPTLQWHAQQTAPFRILRKLWKRNTTRFSHWHHPASSDRSEMPVHVKLGVKKKNFSWCSNCHKCCGGPWLVRRCGFLFWQFCFFFFSPSKTCRVLKTWMILEWEIFHLPFGSTISTLWDTLILFYSETHPLFHLLKILYVRNLLFQFQLILFWQSLDTALWLKTPLGVAKPRSELLLSTFKENRVVPLWKDLDRAE